MIEIGKTYRLANGCEYRNALIDAGGEYPVRGFYKHPEGFWLSISHMADGKHEVGEFCLVEVRPRKTREVWLNIYNETADCPAYGHKTEWSARKCGPPPKLEARKLITIEYEVGEGL